jgi:CRISPR-associated protein Cmr2
MSTQSAQWNDLLLSWMHDPPDKALAIPGHEARAARYISMAVGRQVRREELHSSTRNEDWGAAEADRLPLPNAGRNYELAVDLRDGPVLVRHSLSGGERRLEGCAIDEERLASGVEAVTRGLNDPRLRLLAAWRLLPERLSVDTPWMAHLPADTRVPDHTIWNHMDMAAGLRGGVGSAHGQAFLSFSINPVQGFIAAARSIRDLWSGSAILSWLAFRAMVPVIERCGPGALVLPSLSGAPLLALWLRKEKGLKDSVPLPGDDARRAPSVPHRFLAVVPTAEARELAASCERSAREAWLGICSRVRQELEAPLGAIEPGWARRWDAQAGDFFEFRTAVLPWGEVTDEAAAALLGKEADGQAIDKRQARFDLAGRLMEAARAIRAVPEPTPPPEPGKKVPGKCSLLGDREQMGPNDIGDACRKFWDAAAAKLSIGGVRLRNGERLSAAALAKRFAGPAFFAERLEIERQGLRFPDTATVAAANWLDVARIDWRAFQRRGPWSGQWLHWRSQAPDRKGDEDPVPDDIWREIERARKEFGAPPAYYAVLVMDGDKMGQWLRGDQPGAERDCLTRYTAVSRALGRFAVQDVPGIVREHHGTLVYAGGDDVLALLPADRALACAEELRERFGGIGGQKESWFTPTLSAGLALVHYKEDLRRALAAARDAERRAKDGGRDALELSVCRRSGEHSTARCPWDLVKTIWGWTDAFAGGASDRWAYRLRADAETLDGLSPDAQAAEIRRQVDRSEKETRDALGGGEAVARVLGDYRRMRGRDDVLKDFILLVQAASFIARGGSER